MHPVLFEYGRITLYTYGLFIAFAFLVGMWLAGREAERRGQDPRMVQDLGFLVLISAIVGARLFFVLVEWRHFVDNPLKIFEIWKGGLVFYGGFTAAALAAVLYVRAKGLPTWEIGDIAAPSLALGQALGRVGCFFAGCCFGARCDLPWAVTFSDPRSLAPLEVPLHPAQLYAAAANLTIFAVLYWVARPRQKNTGQLLGLYLVLYPVTRFLLEFLRDDPRGTLGALSTSQAMGIPLAAVGLWILFTRRPGREA
jgi:phosphatidylglycerol:prolipoprotein diacylglycerol transferase